MLIAADDLHQITSIIREKYPKRRIYVSGFSLGGNVILKFLGELGNQAKAKNIFGGVAACVPFDPVASQGKLDQGFNRAVYSEVKNHLYSTSIRISFIYC